MQNIQSMGKNNSGRSRNIKKKNMKTEDTEKKTAQKEALRLPKHLGTEQLNLL